MKSPLDTKKLQELCEAVVRNTKSFNEGTIPKAQDDAWAQLVHESLPQLEAFIRAER